MDCVTPYCHQYCTVHNLIPDWNVLVYEGQWERACEQLDSTNNFPVLAGRLCPAPCENACPLALANCPVTIKPIELAIAEKAWTSGWVKPKRFKRQCRMHVAVTGSGPAGLACAQMLTGSGRRCPGLQTRRKKPVKKRPKSGFHPVIPLMRISFFLKFLHVNADAVICRIECSVSKMLLTQDTKG